MQFSQKSILGLIDGLSYSVILETIFKNFCLKSKETKTSFICLYQAPITS